MRPPVGRGGGGVDKLGILVHIQKLVALGALLLKESAMRFSYGNPVEIVGSHSALSYFGNFLDCVRLRLAPVLISGNGGRCAANHFGKFRLSEALTLSVFLEFHECLIIPKMARSQYPQTVNCQTIDSQRCFLRSAEGGTA